MEVQSDIVVVEVNVARAVILDENDRLLVLQRSDDDEYGPGMPDLPGGTIDADETPEVAVVRETFEETGLNLAGVAMRRICEVVTESNEGVKITRITRTFFAACVQNPVVVLSQEHQAFAWEAIEKAPEIFASSPSKLQCIAEVRELQASGLLAA